MGPRPQHGFLNEVLDAAAVTTGECGGQSQQGRAVLGVQAAEYRVRVGSGNRDGLVTGHDASPRRTPDRSVA